MYNHSHPHNFRFRKGPDGRCYMQYKKWQNSEWEPQSNHGVCILTVRFASKKLGMYLHIHDLPIQMQSIPTGVPTLVTPNEAKVDLKHLKADLPRYASAGLTSATIEWWQSFIESLENSMRKQQQSAASSSWLYSELLELARNGVRRGRSMASLSSQLFAMRAAETEALSEVQYKQTLDCVCTRNFL